MASTDPVKVYVNWIWKNEELTLETLAFQLITVANLHFQLSWYNQMTQCSFAKPVNNGLVDLLIGSDNSELRYFHVDLQGKSGGPIASLGPLG